MTGGGGIALFDDLRGLLEANGAPFFFTLGSINIPTLWGSFIVGIVYLYVLTWCCMFDRTGDWIVEAFLDGWCVASCFLFFFSFL